MRTLEDLYKEHQLFAEEKFPDSTWESSLKGLRREIKECEKEGKRLSKNPDLDQSSEEWGIEYVDCFMYLLDSMARAGFTIDDLKEFFQEKLNINNDRNWKKNSNNTYSHI